MAPLMIVSKLFSVFGSLAQASAASAAAQYNAQIAANNATYARQKAAEDERRARVQGRKVLGGVRAGYGASGITVEASPQDVLEEGAAAAELDALTIRHAGEVQAVAFENESNLERFRAKTARTTGYLSAASSLLSGVGKIYDYYNPRPSGTPPRSP